MKTGLYDYDCVVLDLMLPGGNGLDLLRELRRRRNPVGVIIVSAKDSLDDKIKGYALEQRHRNQSSAFPQQEQR